MHGRKLTERMPHPVGTNAKMQAKISATDNFVNTTATTNPARTSIKDSP